ncbi:MAG: HD domain-containing protein [Clostridia bacterium]|nr:HD domain-containing protein [Clostridia bacterium]
MQLDFTDFLYAMSFALDAVEHEYNGATLEHGKRVAWLSMKMAEGLGFSEEQLVDFVACALLHDNAVAEYLNEKNTVQNFLGQSENIQTFDFTQFARHAYLGERNAELLPFRTDVKNIILWHHENADGSGAFGLTQNQTNMRSEILHLADTVDLLFNLKAISSDDFDHISEFIRQESGRLFSDQSAARFLETLSFTDIRCMQEKGPEALLKERLPAVWHDYSDAEIKSIAEFFARIVDYKSPFTTKHSLGVAEKARIMAQHYGFDPEKTIRFYLAGALHDIGKVVVGNEILEKPGKLNEWEYSVMKDHARASLNILRSIHGFEDLTKWAADHHEKLDGTGYSQGLNASVLSFEERLMACIDIYQALTEDRPYKAGMSHAKTMAMMDSMVREGKIDGTIVHDMDLVFGKDGEHEQYVFDASSKKWVCSVCGFISEGETPPDQCPVCHSDAGNFVLS